MSEALKIIAGRNLRALLAKYNMSQAEFAFQFHADERTIGRYINNGINSVDTIQELAMYFNVSPIDFFIN